VGVRRLALIVLLAFPGSAWAQAEAPVDTSDSGGAGYEVRAPIFSVAPGRVRAGSPVTVSVRVIGPGRRVRARVVVGRSVLRLRLRVGRTVTRRWTPSVAPGSYVASLRVRGRARSTFPVTVVAARPVAATITGVFPVQGPYSFGDASDRFGAKRDGHVHQGQDVIAAKGTPLVSPVAGSVFWRKVQPGGAGHYLVIRAADGTDYVFMHLLAGSELVAKGDAVTAGQGIGQVGATGDAQGPHLHFEIWPDGWYAPKSQPIDPLPQLRAWSEEA
jgi:murein DD-endopeptidase MepM/ murein hydrolase activator NlpD